MNQRFLQKQRLIFFSPWLLAAAIGLLAVIIAVLAANNIRREKDFMTSSLFQKGQVIIRFVAAGLRVSAAEHRMGMMLRINPESEITKIQQLIEQASEEPEIHYITVVDEKGLILAHSNPELIGTLLVRDFKNMTKNTADEETGSPERFHIVTQSISPRKVFEVFSPFKVNRVSNKKAWSDWREQFLKQHPLRLDSEKTQAPRESWHPLINDRFQSQQRFILVGLDMTDIDYAVRQYLYQIIVLSIILLLVGLGGWISLLVAQNYSISQQTLKRIQAFTGMLISRLPVGIIATDQEGRIRTFNSAAAELTGISINNAVNKPPENSLPSVLAEHLSNLSESEEISDKEISLSRGDDELTVHLSSLPVYSRENIFMGRVLLLYDLSEIKRLERKVQRHDRLVALGKMAAGVAHEVRNPLSSIKGFATLLGKKFQQGSDEQKSANLLVQEAERLNRSISELLNYARPTPLTLVDVDLRELLTDSLKLVSTDATSLDIDLLLEADPDLPVIQVDPDRIKQVLLNILLNGFQAMEHGGKIVVRALKSENGNDIEIKIEDNGCGIPEEILENILDPYFTTKPEGTGLGLAMAYKIIEEHGGTLHFDSVLHQGTTVTITLPLSL
jgi:two-component system sensor histidine kinase HydH